MSPCAAWDWASELLERPSILIAESVTFVGIGAPGLLDLREAG